MTEFQQHLENVVKYFLENRNLHYRNEFKLSGWYFLTSESCSHICRKITRSDIQKAFIQECGIVKARSYYTTYFDSFNVFLHEWVRDGNDPEFKVNPFLKFLIPVDNYFFEMNHCIQHQKALLNKNCLLTSVRLSNNKNIILYGIKSYLNGGPYPKYSTHVHYLYQFKNIMRTHKKFLNVTNYLYENNDYARNIESNKFVEIFDYMCFLLPVFNEDIVNLVYEYLDNFKVVNRQIFC